MKSIKVVAAIIKSVDEKRTPVILATQRGYGEFECWREFPGERLKKERHRRRSV